MHSSLREISQNTAFGIYVIIGYFYYRLLNIPGPHICHRMHISCIYLYFIADCFTHVELIFTRGQFWPSGIVVACVCLSVCASVCAVTTCLSAG